ADGPDGWLLYDFRGLNPIAADVTSVGRQGGHLATRRWYYLIPATGEPRGLVHAIEKNALAHLPGSTTRYAGRDQLEAGLRALLGGIRRVAMEYSPGCAIPYVARVDAGTIELVREMGAEVVSSGDLIQRFSAVWDDDAIATHRGASEKLYRIKDRAFETIARAFEVICRGRDAAAALVRDAARAGREVRGWEVDRAASAVLRGAGYDANILHRTGHSLGETVHGNGVNMDDYETHDDRRLLPGTGFTIEPGVYFDDFGVRTEINMVVGVRDAAVTGPIQTEILTLM